MEGALKGAEDGAVCRVWQWAAASVCARGVEWCTVMVGEGGVW